MSSTYEEQNLPPEFLAELFRLSIHDSYIQQIVSEKVQPTWLVNQEEKDFLLELKFQTEIEHRKPTFGTMLLAAKANKNKGLQDYIGSLRDVELADPVTMISNFEEFCKQAMFVSYYDQTATLYNKKTKGGRAEAYKLFVDAAGQLNSFSLTNDLFEPVFGNFGRRNAERILEASRGFTKLPTGIDGLDHYLHGGPEKKELMCLIAESKGGKSFALTHMGVNYARRGHATAHIQLEGPKKQCLNRYDACWLGSVYSDVKAGNIPDEKFTQYRKIVKNLGKGEIYVYAPERFKAMNVLELRRIIIDLKKKHNIEVVIVDYSDLLNPDDQHYKLSDERHRQELTMQALKQLAMELDVLIITATQTSSISYELLKDPDFVIRREDLAESKGKVRPVDYLISINRTPEERKQGLCRLYIEAARDHEGDQLITICQNLKRSRFFDRKKTISMGFWDDEQEEAA